MARGRRRRIICAAALASRGAALAPVKTNRIAELRRQRAEIDAELQALEAGHRHATPKQQIRALYDAFNARDGPAVAALLADDVVYEDLLLGESTICRGKAALPRQIVDSPNNKSS